MELLRAENIQKKCITPAGGKPCRALAGSASPWKRGNSSRSWARRDRANQPCLIFLATLDTPTSGEVFLEGQSMKQIKGKPEPSGGKAGLRLQDFNLLDTFTVATTSCFRWKSRAGRQLAEMEQRLKPVVCQSGH